MSVQTFSLLVLSFIATRQRRGSIKPQSRERLENGLPVIDHDDPNAGGRLRSAYLHQAEVPLVGRRLRIIDRNRGSG